MADRKTGGRPRPGAGSRQERTRRPVKALGRSAVSSQVLVLGRRNWLLLGSGILASLAGFGFLAAGDITVAPVLLLAGYAVLIPMGLVAGSSGDDGGGERAGPGEEIGS